MTTAIIHLPTGTFTALDELNVHDLRQYYMYQMDMLDQAEDMLSSLGIAGWAVGEHVDNSIAAAVARQEKSPAEFLVPPAEGNLMPSFYDGGSWQGVINDSKGRSYPFVEKMDEDSLRQEVERMQRILTNFHVGTTALVNLAKNIQDATQPPAPAETSAP